MKINIKILKDDKTVKNLEFNEMMAAAFVQRITRGSRIIKYLKFTDEVEKENDLGNFNYEVLVKTMEELSNECLQ